MSIAYSDSAMPIIIDLHGIKLAFQSPDLALRNRFETVYGHLRQDPDRNPAWDIGIRWKLSHLPAAPMPPVDAPPIGSNSLVSYFDGNFSYDSDAQIWLDYG